MRSQRPAPELNENKLRPRRGSIRRPPTTRIAPLVGSSGQRSLGLTNSRLRFGRFGGRRGHNGAACASRAGDMNAINIKLRSGFTLTELMAVIAIAAILMAIGVPSYRYVGASYRMSSEVNGLLGDLQFARSE